MTERKPITGMADTPPYSVQVSRGGGARNKKYVLLHISAQLSFELVSTGHISLTYFINATVHDCHLSING